MSLQLAVDDLVSASSWIDIELQGQLGHQQGRRNQLVDIGDALTIVLVRLERWVLAGVFEGETVSKFKTKADRDRALTALYEAPAFLMVRPKCCYQDFGGSHYHCGNCGKPSSSMGHWVDGEFRCDKAPALLAVVCTGCGTARSALLPEDMMEWIGLHTDCRGVLQIVDGVIES